MTDKELKRRAKICGALMAKGASFKDACSESGYPYKDNPCLPIGVELEMERVLDEIELATGVSAEMLVNEFMDIAQLAKKKERYADAVSALRSVAEMKRLIGAGAKGGMMTPQKSKKPSVPERTQEDVDAYAETKIIGERFNRLEV